MENLLIEYLERSFSDKAGAGKSAPGPIVTISREAGCPSKLIAQMLTSALNMRSTGSDSRKWRFISKEVVEDAARHLELNPAKVKHLLNAGAKGVFEDILASFSQTYVSDNRIRKIITNVVRSIAEEGYAVIVGRGGATILRDRRDTIHIRLQAPLEWRIREMREIMKVTEKEAIQIIMDNDKQRTALIDLITGGKFQTVLFDIIFNCSTLSKEEIVHAIIALMESKKIAHFQK